MLRNMHVLIVEYRDALAELLTLKQGKPLAESKGEIGLSAAYFVCANRFYAQAGIHDAFVERFVENVRTLRLASGFDPETSRGPLINEKAMLNVERLVADAVAGGATVLTGGKRSSVGAVFYEPTVITGMTAKMAIAKNEVFGPVAPIASFTSGEEVLLAANASDYDLASYVYTRDLSRAHRMLDALETGLVGVKEGLITTEAAPFGGFKSSGMGRERSRYGMDAYLEIKYASVGL